jgi:dTDP-4-dehydrorhamnose reductase
MRIAITGSRGTLGTALEQQGRLAGHTMLGLNRPDHDLTDLEAITRGVAETAPDVVIHPAAYTDVDGCELHPATAYTVNGLGTRNMALACAAQGVPLVYISTNCVFDGAADRPYREWDLRRPISVYGASKYAGEQYVESLLTRFYIVRISWLYGHTGNHFVHKIVKAADSRGALGVVADEISTPTYADDLAEALLQLVQRPTYGWYHLVNGGGASRMEYAAKIMELTGRAHIPITPMALKDFVRPSRPPPYSVLQNTVGAADGIVLRPWEAALADYIAATPELWYNAGAKCD